MGLLLEGVGSTPLGPARLPKKLRYRRVNVTDRRASGDCRGHTGTCLPATGAVYSTDCGSYWDFRRDLQSDTSDIGLG